MSGIVAAAPAVIPAKAGIHCRTVSQFAAADRRMDSRLRGNDGVEGR
jgi:hypothetical protein